MSPGELEEYLELDPFRPLRLTLASGDQVVVRAEDEPFVSSLALILRGDRVGQRVVSGSRLVSIPNIVLIEPLTSRPPEGRRRPRRR